MSNQQQQAGVELSDCPPLPRAFDTVITRTHRTGPTTEHDVFTADQMRAYVAADRQQRGKADHVVQVAEIFRELERATAKFPTWPTDPLHALGIVHEEVGELAKEVLQMVYEPHKTNRDKVKAEAIQAAAMCLRFFSSLDRYEYMQGSQHSQDAQ